MNNFNNMNMNQNPMQGNMGNMGMPNQFSAPPGQNRMQPNMGMPSMMPNQMSAGMGMGNMPNMGFHN